MTIAVPSAQQGNSDPDLRERVKNALDETRTMILGTQILLGFQYQLLFHPGFPRLPGWGRDLDAAALVLTLTAACLQLACIPYHRVAEKGDDTTRLVEHASLMAASSLVMMALAVGADVTLAMEHAMPPLLSAACGLLAVLTCLGFWFLHGVWSKRRPRRDKRAAVPLKERISLLLTESRVILPGGQALLGIQFIAIFSDAFGDLPASSRLVHMASLVLLALAMVMLLAPAAYHRVAAGGDARPDVERFGARMVLGALAPLGLGMACDLYVTVTEVTGSPAWGAGWSLFMLLAMLALWLAWPLAARRSDS